MSTEELHNKPNDGDEIETLLRGLKKVKAPGDFDLHLHARIANHSAGDRAFSFGFLRFAAPAVLVLIAAFAGYFVFIGGNAIDTAPAGSSFVAQQLPEVEESIAAPQAPAATPQSTEKPDVTVAVSTVDTAARPEPRSTTAILRRTERLPAGGGSEDRAATAPDETIFPPGIRPDPPLNGIPASPQGETEISVPDVLSLLGVKAVYGESGWRVVSAESTGAGGRSGVRVGDIIISLGTTVLAQRTVLKAPANIGSLRVRRAGSELELKLGR